MELLDPQLWSLLSSVVSVIGFIVIIYSAIIALRQLKEMAKDRHLEAMLRIFDLMGNEKSRLDRKYIYTKLQNPPSSTTEEDMNHIMRVTTTFDKIGLLVSENLVPKEILLRSHCEVFIRTWMVLKPYVEYHREKIGGRHANHFEELAELALKYHEKHHKGVELKIVTLEDSAAEEIAPTAKP